MGRPKIKGSNLSFDPEFRFLLALDPKFEAWRVLAAEYYPTQKKSDRRQTALSTFFVRFLHSMKLDKCPLALFKKGASLPDLLATLGQLDVLAEKVLLAQHDMISDFLDWVLRVKLAETDAEGFAVIPAHLANPFPRLKRQVTGRRSDMSFAYATLRDPRMEAWRALAEEWMALQKLGIDSRIRAIDRFLNVYIINKKLPHHPIEYLKRSTPKPIFIEVLLAAKKKGTGRMNKEDAKENNHVAEFIDWILIEKLSDEDDHGHRLIPHELHNPVVRLSGTGVAVPTESIHSALSIRYIRELRGLLAQGPNFRDWVWAQGELDLRKGFGDWFLIDPKLVNPNDPDCVTRERDSSNYERRKKGYPPRVTEMWSPARAVGLYIKLELPLRTRQVRMLDSGEADTWRYIHSQDGGTFELNDSPLATGSEKRPYQRGVFHRYTHESGVGLFINTNKTADINKPENAKGYVIPWAHETVLYWLEKLRNWQERYNPIDVPVPWKKLERKHFGEAPPSAAVMGERGTACFLFRDAAAIDDDGRKKPLISGAMENLWYRLLGRLEQRCLERNETLSDGTAIQFVDHGSRRKTHFPLHALRVSLISYLIFDLQLPEVVVSKLIAGHASLIMTIYYTKLGHAYMKEVMDDAARNQFAAEEANHRRFLMDATFEQVSQRFASVSPDALRAAIGRKSAATFVFEDRGVCPVGGTMCDVGGECIRENAGGNIYAPVTGYPHERNCIRCRFFLSGPAWLPGLIAHFNTISYEAREQAERFNDHQNEVTRLENRRDTCLHKGRPFTEHRELERLSQRNEEETEAMGKLINDMQATYHLIARSLEIIKQENQEGVALVAVGDMQDIRVGFEESHSELYQLEVMCENATIYPGIDARKPAIRRGQLLDCMLELNNMPPVFFKLDPKQQLAAGNALMGLIQARAGSLKGAVEYGEGQRLLQDLGIVDETWDVLTEHVSGTSVRNVIEAARKNHALPNLAVDHDAS